MEAHYGRPLALLATMDGDRSTEAEIHARFAHLRFGRTEQFRPGPDLMAFINRPLLVDANPAVVEAMRPAGGDVFSVRLELPPDLTKSLGYYMVDNDMTSYVKAATKLVEEGLARHEKAKKGRS